jgi:hypoxanthine phosphoribosyltransferase
MESILVKDKYFEKFITAATIDQHIRRIAEVINNDYKDKNPLFLCVLNGAFIFAADLLRKITCQCQVSFVKYSSYSGTSSKGKINTMIGLNEKLIGRHIIIVEDIIDTGLTMDHLLKELKTHNPADVRIACFCFKPDAFKKSFKIDYLAIKIPNEFVVGYGLDYDGFGRNLPDIYKIPEH